jgi:hypothetical protein
MGSAHAGCTGKLSDPFRRRYKSAESHFGGFFIFGRRARSCCAENFILKVLYAPDAPAGVPQRKKADGSDC